MKANLVIEAEVLDESDEHCRRPIVSAFQQKTFSDGLVGLQLAHLYTPVDRLFSHQTICRPLTTYHTSHTQATVCFSG